MINVGSVVEWLERRDCDRQWFQFKTYSHHSVVSFGKTLYDTFPCLAVLAAPNSSYISMKFQPESNILASPEADRVNCLPYVLASPSLSCESGG